ncbi:hypothetical protein FOXB_00940 [Fusarium oxysporum f. sp. conglutinans Fo5176]|uniref:Uncharacterized protein n=1 Tax=Fusarium oxysporum (strain Fo5176) TaxID=660025 RepID=F9F3G5_FUSOF|nr:hypothetical protein FOXB_00940 [Fusarium oxysporum f. sp. conglutinans Fo5176]
MPPEEKDNIERCKYITKDMLDASVFSDNQKTKQFMAMTRELSQTFSSARPTAFHHLIAQLAKRGQIRRLYTQNIDDIDVNIQPLATDVPLSLTGPWPKTIQLHGSLSKTFKVIKCPPAINAPSLFKSYVERPIAADRAFAYGSTLTAHQPE